jgi:hypothetical protein
MKTQSLLRGAVPFAVAALALAGAGVARADANIQFSFAAGGFGVIGPCADGGDCQDAFTVGDADDTAGNLFAIPGDWSQFLNFTLVPSTGTVSGTWSLFDNGSAFNDLSGTFTGQWLQLPAGQSQLTLQYAVTDGGGLFAGASGSGQSLLTADADFNYTEVGHFSISAVPEPSDYALLIAGLGVVGLVARRQRRR